MRIEPWIKTSIYRAIPITLGLITILFSPARDQFANFTIVLGFLLLETNLIIFVVLKGLSILELNGELILSILSLLSSILLVIGMIFGRFLGTWTPFSVVRLPFGYYLFLSFLVILTLFMAVSTFNRCYTAIRSLQTEKNSSSLEYRSNDISN